MSYIASSILARFPRSFYRMVLRNDIHMLGSSRSRRRASVPIEIDVINPNDSDRQILKKLQNLQKLTAQVKQRAQISAEDHDADHILSSPQSSIEENQAVEQIYHLVSAGSEKSGGEKLALEGNSVFAEILYRDLKIPKSVTVKLGLEKYIKSRNEHDWNGLMKFLDGNIKALEGIPVKDVENFVAAVPLATRKQHISTLEKVLEGSQVHKTRFIHDLFLAAQAENCKNIKEAEVYFDKIIENKLKPSVHSFGNIFKAISKTCKHNWIYVPHQELRHYRNQNLDKINKYLALMEKYSVKPNLKVYTGIMQSCIVLHDYNQAQQVFDLCKFQGLHLDVTVYNSMMLVATKQKNLERCLDLFEEMEENSVEGNGDTYLILAQACSRDAKFLVRAWQFILKYMSLRSSNTLNKRAVLVMMMLTAKDMDLPMSRVFFWQSHKRYLETGIEPGPEFVNLLFESYKWVDFEKRKVPVMFANDQTRNLRLNLMSTVDFKSVSANGHDLPPLLPKVELSRREIFEESRAVWSYILLNYPHYVNIHNITSYLKVLLYHGESLEDFKTEFERLTYFEDEGLEFKSKKEVVVFELPEDQERSKEVALETQTLPPLVGISRSQVKSIPRSHSLYKLALFASKKFKDLQYMQKVWEERGKYRHTSSFRNLSIGEKKEYDFEFAREMVECLLAVGLVHDALNIVLSTEKQFRWSFYYLKNLFVYAETIGDEMVKSKVREITRKNSSLKSKDFRVYTARKH